MSEATPMMAQYLAIKEQNRDAVLFFRLGDFYEMFNEDAVEVSRLLNLTLTKRAGNPMCGIPFHASRVYIARLLRAGKKIAICEQLSIPGPGKGLAERKVVEVITPGTVLEDAYLDSSLNNYLASLSLSVGKRGASFGFAYLDISTGDFSATSFPEEGSAERFRKELGRIDPREILVQQSILQSHPDFAAILAERPSLLVNKYPDWSYNPEASYRKLCGVFGTESLGAFRLGLDSPEVPAAGLLVEYLQGTSGFTVKHIDGIHVFGESEYVSIDDSTRKNLELMLSLRDGGSAFTLYEVLNDTRTSMGSRLLRSWIHHPLTDRERIAARHEAVERLYRSQKLLASTREALSSILDIERLCARVSMDRAHGKDLVALGSSLDAFFRLDGAFRGEGKADSAWPPYRASEETLGAGREVSALIRDSIDEECPVALNEGGIIRPGWSEKLDELRSLRDNSNAVLESYLEEERALTGIANLKIRYNRLTGYYLEVSKGRLASVPTHFIRRRSLANGDRYTTDRLVELETELNGVHANIIECEQELFLEIRRRVAGFIKPLMEISHAVALIDVYQSLAYAATRNAWSRPSMTEDGTIDIVDGRHPVVEAHLPSGEFVPNSIVLSSNPESEYPSFALITGPNMAGKSTFLRQTALISLMAQIGSFVPAAQARLSVVDRIFCRVGASDNLARGESTFLVEMTETAHILRSATRDSLVIMDEVGRGTSTEDGLSIAQAVTEYLLSSVGAKTLFATHYHELSRMEHEKLANYCLDVLETEGTVVFLKKVRPGASANSYGVHVARLAGIPEPVLARAQAILVSLHEGRKSVSDAIASGPIAATPAVSAQAAAEPRPALPQLFSEEELVLEEIISAEPDAITPLEALQLIARWKKRLFPVGK
jgi:DNA mismatch repair protein MutS